MTGLEVAVAGWLWGQFGKKIIDTGSGVIKEAWEQFNWYAAEEQYRARIIEQLSTVRILGYPNPIDIATIYTDAQVLSKLTAMKRYNFIDLKGIPKHHDIFNSNSQRQSAVEVVNEHKRIYILGKPGAGKTTFLKHLAISACRGKLEATPIYISLKEWSDSKKELINFIEEKFDICGFPDAKAFILNILESGNAIVLLDGLDEVKHGDKEQNAMLQEILNFTEKYHNSQICLTCRIAANDYSFNNFTYVEIADFNTDQQINFIRNWFSLEPLKLIQFKEQWQKPENSVIHDLAKTPLLLTLICLSFNETLSFSKRRVDLYSEAVDALLKKWDSSRAIVRGDIYNKLDLTRKKQLISYIAYQTFIKEQYLIRHNVVTDEIRKFVAKLPYWDKQIEVDSDNILKEIESHHGLIVERAKDIFSFSHLTIHEYFTALYILENVSKDSLNILVDNMVLDVRWREVMLMCSSSQSDAAYLLIKFAHKIWQLICCDEVLVDLINFIQITDLSPFSCQRVQVLPSVSFHYDATISEHALEVAGQLSLLYENSKPDVIQRARKLVKVLQEENFQALTQSQQKILNRYLSLIVLFIECLQISSVENRSELEDMILKSIPGEYLAVES